MSSYQDYLEEMHYNVLKESISINNSLAGYGTLGARPTSVSVWGRGPHQHQFEGDAYIGLGAKPTSVSVWGRAPHQHQFKGEAHINLRARPISV